MKSEEIRRTYVQLKTNVQAGAMAAVVLARKETLTCRVMVNVGLEMVIAGVEFLKMHGIGKRDVLEFVERLYDRPGNVEGMEKGGINEHLLRMAMKFINGPIIRPNESGPEQESAAHAHDDVAGQVEDRNLNPDWN